MKEFAPWRGGLRRGQRSSLQYAQLMVSKSCKSNPETGEQGRIRVVTVLIQRVLFFKMGKN